MMPEECLLVLIGPPALEEPLADWLLDRSNGTGFSTVPLSGHGSGLTGLSVAEQVAGRQRRVQFQIHGPRAGLEALLSDLKAEFAGADLHYWMIPLLAAGHLGHAD
ncbi:MAG TPA: DUF3240 family protein [Gammaproteobacteria bacterium]|nr:DUF3240 family protein [Gammaproteobacteria bacterium]